MKYYKLDITRVLLREGETQYASTPEQITRYALEFCFDPADMWREHCFLVFLDAKNAITGHFHLGIGGTESVVIDKKAACIAMLGSGASKAVLVHNHPGEDPSPGQSDIRETESLKKAFASIGCSLVDHVIIADGVFFSFADEKPTKFDIIHNHKKH